VPDPEIWETWDPQLNALIPQAIPEVLPLVTRGKYGLIGLVQFLEHLVRDRNLDAGMLNGKIGCLLEAINLYVSFISHPDFITCGSFTVCLSKQKSHLPLTPCLQMQVPIRLKQNPLKVAQQQLQQQVESRGRLHGRFLTYHRRSEYSYRHFPLSYIWYRLDGKLHTIGDKRTPADRKFNLKSFGMRYSKIKLSYRCASCYYGRIIPLIVVQYYKERVSKRAR
jgi:hypothetical protein